MNTYDFDEAYKNALDAIVELRAQAETLKSELDDIIDACETLENDI